jgi:hypothetical protein
LFAGELAAEFDVTDGGFSGDTEEAVFEAGGFEAEDEWAEPVG